MTDGITPEQAILVAKAAGFDTGDLERQACADPVERAPAAPAPLEPAKSPEVQMAEALRDHLNASVSKWHSL